MDDLGKPFPAAEGMIDAERSTLHGKHNEKCLNCGAKLLGEFCHQCGQKDIPRRQSMGELWMNFISSFWNYEGKFLLATKYLILRPGFLAMEYTAGRRESYYHPVRMYVFISFIFFLIFFSLPEKKDVLILSEEDKRELAKTDEQVVQSLAAVGLDTLVAIAQDSVRDGKDSTMTGQVKPKKKFNFGLSKADYPTIAAYDSVQALLADSERDNWLTRRLTKRAIELNQKFGDEPKQFVTDFGKLFLENFSKVLFFLLPVFALLLKLLYVRKDYFYSEHLVFSIYYYNFFYLAASLMLLVGVVPALDWLSTLIGFWIYFYLLVGMKRMYQQRWGKTILKFMIFSFLFMTCVSIGFVINAFAILMLI